MHDLFLSGPTSEALIVKLYHYLRSSYCPYYQIYNEQDFFASVDY